MLYPAVRRFLHAAAMVRKVSGKAIYEFKYCLYRSGIVNRNLQATKHVDDVTY